VCGVLVGWFFSNKGISELKSKSVELLRQDAISRERVSGLNLQLESASAVADKLRIELTALHKEVSEKTARIEPLESALQEVRQERSELKNEISLMEEKLKGEEVQVQVLGTRNQLLEQQLSSLRENLEELKKQTRSEFENLANKILEAKTKAFSETTEKSLFSLLDPLRERLNNFEKVVNEKYVDEAKERSSLKGEIERLISLNDKMATETNSLTQALRGDSKVQGDWGELVLERILESSGLREDHEYTLQKTHRDDDGDKFKPDVIVNLPENKHIIIDSKVSLTAYERYHSSTDSLAQDVQIKEHIRSMEKHISELSEKHYSKLKGVNSPEFVFMFVPIEPAYLLAMRNEPDLSAKAWRKGVAIVTATTLLTTLKTVASIWKLENQNKNALEIAQEGASLYDKFVGFLEDFEKIGKTFENGHKLYGEAMNKLKDGQGNVFRKLENLRELGAAPKKKIRQDLLE
jgi:DNA recombination protein RmuC